MVQNSKAHVYQALRRFLDDPNPGVLAIKGVWGIGKTHIWNDFLESYKKDAKQSGYAYVSLFGVNSTSELRQMIFAKHESLGTDKRRRFWHVTVKRGANLLALLDPAPVSYGLLKNTEVFSQWVQDKLVRNFIVCIDDLERKEDSLTGSALLGLITGLRDERKCKVVLIYNDAEISDDLNTSFGEYREKVIDREVTYSPTVRENFTLIFPEANLLGSQIQDQASTDLLADDGRALEQVFASLNVRNIRVFQKTKTALDYFAAHIRDRYPRLYPRTVRQTIKICCLYYLYGNRWTLENLISTSPIGDFIDSGASDPKEIERRAARKPVRDVAYSPQETDAVIVEYLKNGYVDWDSCTSLLNDAEKQFEAGELNTQLNQLWSKYWSNFTTPQEPFIRSLYEFVTANWQKMRLQDVVAADELLKTIDPSVDLSSIVEQRIASFAESHAGDKYIDLNVSSLTPKIRSLEPVLNFL